MIFCVMTLGCKANQYDAQAIEGILAGRGHTPAQAGQGCDVCIVNTCAVTAESARKSRQAVRRAKKLEPGALVAVCGCLSQLDPSAARELGADLVGGSGDRRGFALEIERLSANAECRMQNAELRDETQGSGDRAQGSGDGGCENNSQLSSLHTPNSTLQTPNSTLDFEDLPPGGVAGRTRALLKIQDGCDNCCAYCVIPRARGRARSLPPDRAAELAAQLDARGFREIVVTGIEISSYGKDLMAVAQPEPKLIDVLKRISAAAPNARLRLGSLDPGTLTEPFCGGLLEIPNLCPHFHISLQSGCDGTLRRMGRRYGAAEALEAIRRLRRLFPDCGITADLIAGFPGETGAEFAQTLDFIKSAAFSDMHVFPFSPRPGTRAADMPGQIKKSARAERARAAAEAAAETARAFKAGQVGKTVEVLFERESGGCWYGHSGNYLEIAVKSGGAKNELRPVRIAEVRQDGTIIGEIVN